MKKLLLAIMPLLLITSCEDTSDDSSEPTLEGTWSYVATEYDQTCTGEGEVWETGTMTFSGNNLNLVYTETFESWCDGTVTGDVCDEDGYTYNISEFEEQCDGTYSSAGCNVNQNHTFTFLSDSLTVTITESIEISEAQAPECEYVGGTYANGLCTITGTMGPFLVSFDGNTATFNDLYVEDEDEPYCDVFVLTRQQVLQSIGRL